MQDRAWGVAAECGMIGSDIDKEFFDSLSDIELVYFSERLAEVTVLTVTEKNKRKI